MSGYLSYQFFSSGAKSGKFLYTTSENYNTRLFFSEANISGVNVYSLHPGIVTTELTKYFDSAFFYGANFGFQWILRPLWKNPEQGAQTIIHCAVDEKVANETGLYYK